MEKMTYAVALNSAIACETLSAEVREKLSALLGQIERKASASANADRKPTAKQMANASIKESVMAQMVEDKPYTIGEMLKAFDFGEVEMTNQRLSALIRQLKVDGVVTRTEVKGKAYFAKPSHSEVGEE